MTEAADDGRFSVRTSLLRLPVGRQARYSNCLAHLHPFPYSPSCNTLCHSPCVVLLTEAANSAPSPCRDSTPICCCALEHLPANRAKATLYLEASLFSFPPDRERTAKWPSVINGEAKGVRERGQDLCGPLSPFVVLCHRIYRPLGQPYQNQGSLCSGCRT